MRRYEALAGGSITTTCQNMVAMAAKQGESVTADFNGIMLVATGGMSANELEHRWRTEVKQRQEAYEASPEGQAAKKKQDEAAKRSHQAAQQGIVAFDVGDESAWNKWRESNEDGGYGECCLRYAARWANLMDAQIASGAKLEDIADKTSHEADTEGITGFMYGAAVSMLSNCWRHGESLRRWHNLKTQIKHEGEKANESGGVLNPALLSVDIA